MASTIPQTTNDNIRIIIASPLNPRYRIQPYILNALSNSKIDTLHINEIFVIDSLSASAVLQQYAPGNLWMNRGNQIGMGKAVGIELNGTITNNLFFHIDLFNHIFTNSPYSSHANYVPHHEFGHCYDHSTRGEIISPPLLMPPDYFILERVHTYYLYIVKGELSACVFSGYAAFHGLVTRQLNVIDEHFDTHFSLIDINDPFTLADFVWFVMSEFSKIVGYRIGNLSFNAIRLSRPSNVDSNVFDILINDFEVFLASQWSTYPAFNQEFNDGCIAIFHNICNALGYRFVLDSAGDTLERIIP